MQDRKIKVLQIAFNDLGNGGVQNQIMAITRQTVNKAQNDVLVWKSNPAFYDEEFSKYGKVIRKPHYEGSSYLKGKLDFFTRYFRVKKAVYQTLKEYGPYDVVHSHKLFESAACLSAAHKAGVPVRIAHAHITNNTVYKMTPVRFVIKQYNNIYRRIIRKYATHMIGCSGAAADYVFGKGYGQTVHIGINLELFDMTKYQAKPHDGIVLLNIGTFSIHKNQLFAVEAFAELKKLRDDVKLVLIGRGEEYKKLVETRIQELGLEDDVVFKPHDSVIPQEMADSDLFLLPSNFEGLPVTAIEAQSMGLKCFISSSVTEEANCGFATYLDLSDGAEIWAKEIDKYIQLYGTEKVKQNVEEFSEKKMAERVFDIYQTALR